MQNIHVKRYQETQGTSYQGCIEPEDKSWVVFIDKYGEATFWRRTKTILSNEAFYVDVELPLATGAMPCGQLPQEPKTLPPPLSEEGLRALFEGHVSTADPLYADVQRELFEKYVVTEEGRAKLCSALGLEVKWPVPEGNPFSYTVKPGRESKMDTLDGAAHKREDELYPDRKKGFYAYLNCRSGSWVWGDTEYEAVRELLWEVAKMCTSGYLDHTGSPSPGGGPRRREAVYGK